MTTIGVFSVKRIHQRGSELWTYGGFGLVIESWLDRFDSVVLVAHEDSLPPGPQHYRIDHPRLRFIALPETPTELDFVLALPAIISRISRAVREVDIVQARMPDYTGVIAAFCADRAAVPCFAQVIADWRAEGRSMSWSRKWGLGTLLKIHYYLYTKFEEAACRGRLSFVQGKTAFDRINDGSNTKLTVSTAHKDKDIRTAHPRFFETPWTILTVARLVSIKNQQILLHSLRELRISGRNFHLQLVGSGPQEVALKRLSIELGIAKHVNFVGGVQHGKELWEFFDQADVFVLPSLSEGTPKVVLEAMARGLPVIATEVGGIPSVVQHMQNGLLIPPADKSALESTLIQIADDTALRESLVRGGTETSRQHTIECESERAIRMIHTYWPSLKIVHTANKTRSSEVRAT